MKPDVIVSILEGGLDANVVIDTQRARTLSREADAFFARLPPFVALVQNEDGGFGFVDVEEVLAAGEEPAALDHPLQTTRFLNWLGRSLNAQRPLMVMTDEPPPRVRTRPLREARTRLTRRGRRDL